MIPLQEVFFVICRLAAVRQICNVVDAMSGREADAATSHSWATSDRIAKNAILDADAEHDTSIIIRAWQPRTWHSL